MGPPQPVFGGPNNFVSVSALEVMTSLRGIKIHSRRFADVNPLIAVFKTLVISLLPSLIATSTKCSLFCFCK